MGKDKDSMSDSKQVSDMLNKMKDITGQEFTVKDIDGGIAVSAVEDYYKFIDQGVAGTESGSSKGGFKYGNKMPPASAFSKYTSDKNAQFAIAKSIQKKGIEAKNYTKEIEDADIFEDTIEDIYFDKLND